MENKTNWVIIIGVVAIVAVLASFVTLQLTGNVIRMNNPDRTSCMRSCYNECNNLTSRLRTECRRGCSSSCSRVDVYTKDEVDALLDRPIMPSYAGCTSIGVRSGTGDSACAITNKTCKFGIKVWSIHNESDLGVEGPITRIVPVVSDCSTNWGMSDEQDMEINYLCC